MREPWRWALRVLATLAWSVRNRDALFILLPAAFAVLGFVAHPYLWHLDPEVRIPPVTDCEVAGAIVGFLFALMLDLRHLRWARGGHRA